MKKAMSILAALFVMVASGVAFAQCGAGGAVANLVTDTKEAAQTAAEEGTQATADEANATADKADAATAEAAEEGAEA